MDPLDIGTPISFLNSPEAGQYLFIDPPLNEKDKPPLYKIEGVIFHEGGVSIVQTQDAISGSVCQMKLVHANGNSYFYTCNLVSENPRVRTLSPSEAGFLSMEGA